MFEIHHCKKNYIFFELTKFKSIILLSETRFGYIRTYMYVDIKSVKIFNFFTSLIYSKLGSSIFESMYMLL